MCIILLLYFYFLFLFAMQLTSGMIEELDSLLHTGTEITAIYEELTKTLPGDHLEFTTVRASTLNFKDASVKNISERIKYTSFV